MRLILINCNNCKRPILNIDEKGWNMIIENAGGKFMVDIDGEDYCRDCAIKLGEKSVEKRNSNWPTRFKSK